MPDKDVVLYPRSMREAQELGYMYVGGTCFLDGEFVSENEMKFEGVMEFELAAPDDHSDGNLGSFKARARGHFVFDALDLT
jgi:hypothetical protein